jgi:hypothetical protein
MSLGPEQNGGLSQPYNTRQDSGNTTFNSVKCMKNRFKVHQLAYTHSNLFMTSHILPTVTYYYENFMSQITIQKVLEIFKKHHILIPQAHNLSELCGT